MASGAPDRVVVINDDAAARGRSGAIALASARLLREQGVAVDFLSGSGDVAPELEREGVAVTILGRRHLLGRSRGVAAVRGLFDPASRAALSRWIAANDTPGTVYHLHNWHAVLSPSVFLALRPVASRLVISAQDFFLACPNGGYFDYPRHRECDLVPNGVRCLATACDRRPYSHKLWRVARHRLRERLIDLSESPALVVAVHEAMVPLLARGAIAADHIRVMRNPVVPWRATRVPAERNRDVFFVGRLDDEEGPALLARAARRAGARLRIIGDGPVAASIARDHPEAELLGRRSRAEIAVLIGTARMVVSPTRRREISGFVALEALTSGIPVIVSRFFALADEIAARGFGLVCDPYDETALADAIAALCYDDRRVEMASCRAFSEAAALAPNPEQWCRDLLGLYASRIGEAPPC